MHKVRKPSPGQTGTRNSKPVKDRAPPSSRRTPSPLPDGDSALISNVRTARNKPPLKKTAALSDLKTRLKTSGAKVPAPARSLAPVRPPGQPLPARVDIAPGPASHPAALAQHDASLQQASTATSPVLSDAPEFDSSLPPDLWIKQLTLQLADPTPKGISELWHALLSVAGIKRDLYSRFAESPLKASLLVSCIKDCARSDLVLDDHEKCLYLLHRLHRNRSHEEAELDCRYGPLYLELEAAGLHLLTKQFRDLLRRYQISDSPLAFPRKWANIPPPTEILGEGTYNTVYKVEFGGRQWAWKPAQQDAECGPAAEMCGIQDDQYFPVESNLLTAKIARALAPPYGHCVVGETMVAIINDVPGLLMEIATGYTKDLGIHRRREAVPVNSQAYRVAKESKLLLQTDPAVYKATCQLLGASGLSWEGDQLYLTGADPGHRAPDHLFRNPAFLKGMGDANLVADLAGWCDSHTGNILVANRPGRGAKPNVKIRLIDCDDAGASIDYIEAARAIDDRTRHALYFMSPPALWLDHTTANELQSRRFERAMKALNHDLKGHYPQDRLDGVNRRIAARKSDLKTGALKVVARPEEWLKIDYSDPSATFVGRAKASAQFQETTQ